MRSQHEHLIRLYQILADYFNVEELRTLCFNLKIDYDDLIGEGKQGKARELVTFLDRRSRIAELVAKGKEQRPEIAWDVGPDTGVISSGYAPRWPRVMGLYLVIGLAAVGLGYLLLPKVTVSVSAVTYNGGVVTSSIIISVQPNWRSLLCAVAAMIGGGVLWNVLNVLVGLPFQSGGSGNEPHGFWSFIWGFVTIFPVAIFAFLAIYGDNLSNWNLIVKCITATVLYAVFGGLGAFMFYDCGFRDYVESLRLKYGSQELIIVVIWSFIISLSTLFPFVLLSPFYKDIINIWYLSLQIILSVGLCFIFTMLYLFNKLPPAQTAQLRGVIAGIALRLGLFLGIILSVYAVW